MTIQPWVALRPPPGVPITIFSGSGLADDRRRRAASSRRSAGDLAANGSTDPAGRPTSRSRRIAVRRRPAARTDRSPARRRSACSSFALSSEADGRRRRRRDRRRGELLPLDELQQVRNLVGEHGDQDDTEDAGDDLLPPLLGRCGRRVRGALARDETPTEDIRASLAAVVVVVSVRRRHRGRHGRRARRRTRSPPASPGQTRRPPALSGPSSAGAPCP